jgi:hypothetical protein
MSESNERLLEQLGQLRGRPSDTQAETEAPGAPARGGSSAASKAHVEQMLRRANQTRGKTQ